MLPIGEVWSSSPGRAMSQVICVEPPVGRLRIVLVMKEAYKNGYVPPRSITKPSRPALPPTLLATPKAPILPSSSFLRRSTFHGSPMAFSMAEMYSALLIAFRVASVARIRTFSSRWGTPKSRDVCLKRFSAVTTVVMVSCGIGTFCPFEYCTSYREIPRRD